MYSNTAAPAARHGAASGDWGPVSLNGNCCIFFAQISKVAGYKLEEGEGVALRAVGMVP